MSAISCGARYVNEGRCLKWWKAQRGLIKREVCCNVFFWERRESGSDYTSKPFLCSSLTLCCATLSEFLHNCVFVGVKLLLPGARKKGAATCLAEEWKTAPLTTLKYHCFWKHCTFVCFSGLFYCLYKSFEGHYHNKAFSFDLITHFHIKVQQKNLL